MPMHDEQISRRFDPLSSASPPLILLAGDDSSNLELLAESLESRSFRTAVARDGQEGLRYAGLLCPDLVLLDIVLPGMDGIEVCRRLKTDDETRDIPVIFMIAPDDGDKLLAGFEAGGVDYLPKPLQNEDVIIRLNLRLKLHGLQQQAKAQNTDLNKRRELPNVQMEIWQFTLCDEVTERKRTEEHERERHYLDIFHNISDCIYLVEVTGDGRFRYLETNRAFEALMGVPEDGMRGRYLGDLVRSLDNNEMADRVLAKFRRCLEAGSAINEEITLDLQSGRRIFRSTLTPLFDNAGRIGRILAISRDITERKLAERQIGVMNVILDRIHEAVFLVDMQAGFRFRYVNDRACLSLGYSREKLLSMAVSDIDPHVDLMAVQKMTEQIRQQLFASFETFHHRKDGHVFPVEISATELEYEGRLMGLTVVRDISERKRMEVERLNHLRYFESMDRVNRALQGTNDLEKMMGDVLDIVLSIFDCDRAFLVYPCDPDADSWHVPFEHTRPEYPGVLALGVSIPIDEDMAVALRILLDADGPVTAGLGNEYPLPADISEQFGYKSAMGMAVFPKGDKPWQFGIHQCSRARVWTPDEKKVFQEISRRLADALTSLLAYRTLQVSEREYRTLVENAPYGIARYDVQGRIRYFNPTLEKLLHITTAEARGKRPTECFSLDYYEDYEKTLLHVSISGEGTAFELQYPVADGLEVGIITMVAEREPDGEIVGVLTIGRDVTRKRQMEMELEASGNSVRWWKTPRISLSATTGITAGHTSIRLIEY
jgi:PAS domain S-box-containing protein